MSSDDEQGNYAEYSDDSDYEHHDSVLSTGHRNSLANRESVSNNRLSKAERQSKRLSYGRKHNESKIEEILNKVQQEVIDIHQTQSHILPAETISNVQPLQEHKEQPQEQETVASTQTGENKEITEQQSESTINYSKMLVSINDSQNQSGVFEVMEMSQSGQLQEPQPSVKKQENQSKPAEDLDYLPEQPYVSENVQEQVSLQKPSEEQVSHSQVLQGNNQPQSLGNQLEVAQISHEPQAHSLGDEFNTNFQGEEDDIVKSFRDSTEEKRRNRVPGNSEIEYPEQNDYRLNQDGVNTSGYIRKESEEVSNVRNSVQKTVEQEVKNVQVDQDRAEEVHATEEHEHVITSQDMDLPERVYDQNIQETKYEQVQAQKVEIQTIEKMEDGSQEKHQLPEQKEETQPEQHQQEQVSYQEEPVPQTKHESVPEIRQEPPSEWPNSYGQPQQQQVEVSQPEHNQRHQQIESIVSQPNQDRQSSSQDEPEIQNTLDQRIPLPDSDDQANNNTSNILPPSTISSQSQRNSGLITVISHQMQRQSEQIQIEVQHSQHQSNVSQRFEGIQIDSNKVNPSQVVPSKIRDSNISQIEIADLQSQKDPSHIHDDNNGIETVPEVEEPADSSEPNQIHHQPEEELVNPPQNVTLSEFIKIQEDGSFAQSESNVRFIQSDVPLQPNRDPMPHVNKEIHAEVPPTVMTRVESSEELPESPVKLLQSSKKNDLEASEYFVVDKNLSSLDIYGKSEYNQMVLPGLENTQSRETVMPHPLKNQLIQEAERKREASIVENIQEESNPETRDLPRNSVPKAAEEVPLKFEEPQDPLRNSVSNADLIISTSEMKSTKPKKQKAGSNHKPAAVENPESCKCLIF